LDIACGDDQRGSGRRAILGHLKAFARDPRRVALFALGVVMAYSAFNYESALNVKLPAVLQLDGRHRLAGPQERDVLAGLAFVTDRACPARCRS
jgi:hypothetical protein